MIRIDQFLASLINFDKDKISKSTIDALQPLLDKPEFSGQAVRTKSAAAAGLCEWVRNVVVYNKVYQKVKPKREKLVEANDRLAEAGVRLQAMKAKVLKLEEEIRQLTEEFEKAMQDKNKYVQKRAIQ